MALRDRSAATQFLYAAQHKPHLSTLVKNLYIHPTVGYWQARGVLSECTTLETLECWVTDPRLRPLLASQRMKRLSIMLSGLSFDTEEVSPNFYEPFYTQITHLHFTDHWSSWTTWSGYQCLPNLTHIAFLYDETSLSNDVAVVGALRHVLASCPTLIMCLLQHLYPLSQAFNAIEDSRFLVVRFAPRPRTANEYFDIWLSAGLIRHSPSIAN